MLLIAAFPSFTQPWCAWLAFVPWFLLLHGASGRGAFGWSWLIGFVFFLGSMWWLIHVTLGGWIVLCAYLAIYFGLFGWYANGIERWVAGYARPGCGERRAGGPWVWRLVVPAGWVALEYARAHLLSGMGWNLLAYSQVPWRPFIQVADVTGAWGVSGIIVFVNGLIVDTWSGLQRGGEPVARGSHQLPRRLLTICGVMLALFVYGTWRIRQVEGGPPVRVAVVQGNIPQGQKWDDAYRESIKQRYAALTEQASATHPDLIVWPETSVPGYLGGDEVLTHWAGDVARRAATALLVGAPVVTVRDGDTALMNSAVLLDARGEIVQQHHKLHLVPFGEFIPFEGRLPWLRSVLPPIGDFSPGRTYTVFPLERRIDVLGHGTGAMGHEIRDAAHHQHRTIPFSVLVCFEDIFPELARRFVHEGARLLLVVTNDAWFGPTAAAYQHVQASTFRAVELRVPVARAANTGWSGCVDPTGRWVGSVRDDQGRELFVPGTHTCDLPPAAPGTLYLHWGDWIAWLCVTVAVGSLALPRRYHTQ